MTQNKMTPVRAVVANDDSGFWDVREDGCWLAKFESESVAREFAAVPELIAALREIQRAIKDAHLLDIKKHFSLCVADAAASKALAKAGV